MSKNVNHTVLKDRLTESGMSVIDGQALQLKVFPRAFALRLHPSLEERAGILIPYFTADGKVRNDVFRVRYTEPPTGGFVQKKPAKYGQPAGSPVAAYFPPDKLMNAHGLPSWKELMQDTKQVLYVTEGEFKAASGCAHGFPTIGLGGVYSFQSSKRGIEFLPELEQIGWKGREVRVVYDSDIVAKPEVQQALNALCAKLTERGAVPKIVKLPSSVYGVAKKYGLDDFLVEFSAEAFRNLANEAEPYGPARELYELNERLAYCAGMSMVIDFKPMTKEPYQLIGLYLVEKGIHILGTITDGKKVVPLTKAWLSWPHRREIAGITYEPGDESIVDGYYNAWRGWGVLPERGDAKPILGLIERLVPQKDRRKWFLQWLAYPLKYPGTKLLSASVVWGLEPGTGKSFVGYLMGDIYGPNFIELGTEELHGRFNAWARSRQFVMVDEASDTRSSIRETSSALKKLVTQERIQVNEKYKAQYELRDTINYYFTSNQPHCLQLDNGDRRYFIHRVESPALTPKEAEALDRWRKGGGARAFFHHLIHNVDLTGFDPRGHAFLTEDKSEMIAAARTPADVFIWELMTEGPSEKWGDLYDISDLQQMFESRYPTQRALDVSAFARALRQVGAVHCPGHIIKTPTHPTKATAALWALHNREKWATTKSAAAWSNHYKDTMIRSGRAGAGKANF